MRTEDIEGSFEGRLALTRKDAARALGISPITLDRLTKRGLLRPSRATRRPLYSLREIERFLQDTTSNPGWVS